MDKGMEENEVLGALPQQDRADVAMFLSKFGRMNPEHLTQQIENDRQTEEHRFQRAKLEHNKNIIDRLFFFLAVLVNAGLVVVILFLFRDRPEMAEKILVAVGGLIAGAVGGYGMGKSKRSE